MQADAVEKADATYHVVEEMLSSLFQITWKVEVHEEQFGHDEEEQTTDPFRHWMNVMLAVMVQIERRDRHGRGNADNDDGREVVHAWSKREVLVNGDSLHAPTDQGQRLGVGWHAVGHEHEEYGHREKRCHADGDFLTWREIESESNGGKTSLSNVPLSDGTQKPRKATVVMRKQGRIMLKT